jgi:hypothetical protein
LRVMQKGVATLRLDSAVLRRLGVFR